MSSFYSLSWCLIIIIVKTFFLGLYQFLLAENQSHFSVSSSEKMGNDWMVS